MTAAGFDVLGAGAADLHYESPWQSDGRIEPSEDLSERSEFRSEASV